MKRFLLLSLLISGCFLSAKANHITGGTIYYTYIGQSGGNYQYSVTLLLYRDHNSSGAQLDPTAGIAVFDKTNNSMVWNGNIPMTDSTWLNLGSPDPCISNPPVIFYEVGIYTFTVSLPASPLGYTISYQRCCRINGINNLSGSANVGATYTAEIPGQSQSNGPVNNSARFIGMDTVIVCHLNSFSYDFGAFDADGDSLVYSFCNAYLGGGAGNPAPNPPQAPPYSSVPYAFPYSGSAPLGAGVTVNSQTGLVSGIAPAAGIYVVTVCVEEYRNGIKIATQRKDLQIKVGDCGVAAANLPPQTINCIDYTTSFSNSGDQSLVQSYFWTFGDPASGPNDSSKLANPTHVFTDTGTYIVTLITNRGQPCSDTGITIVKIYPGFFPDFFSSGICVNKPTQFNDATTTQYGVVDSWSWDFGVPSASNDTSHLQNPTYTYNTPGTYNAQLIVTCNTGCRDTISFPVTIVDKPPLSMAFRDTLICRGDNVQLQATGNGIFNWTPNTNIANSSTPSPTVNPPNTTIYFVDLDDNGCLNRDSVNVRVVPFVTLNAFGDTTICQGDAAQLHATSDGLQFSWTPAADLNNPAILNPTATVNSTTTYQVTAFIGGCSTTDNVTVTTVPYPGANAGPDTNICFNSFAQLNGSMVGNAFSWSPFNSLSNPNILNPFATPSGTTAYILSVTDTRGCPKPGRDTVLVTVRPRVNAFAGNDTSVVVGQPLQFLATGGLNYTWSPPTNLNNFSIHNPIAIYDGSFDTITYRVIVSDEQNCLDSAFITVSIFKSNPQIFVPSAFTPNGDGKNDLFRPIGVGIKKMEYFRVYNRWGQLVFSTVINGHGWDGKIGGKTQTTNTFVWIVRGIDYLDRPFFKKGTVTLIK